MESQTAIGNELFQAFAVLSAQPNLAGNATEVELACDGSISRMRCRSLNQPVAVNLIPGLPGVGQAPEIVALRG